MCGITGGVGKNVTESEVRNMALTLQHRGPDETKYWLSLIDAEIQVVDKKLFDLNEELIKLLVAIINSSSRNK
jgi:asparagine synthetase B (glutamine-hydrolysing)